MDENAVQEGSSPKNRILMRKDRMERMQEFTNHKKRIHALLNSQKLGEVKEAYNQLYVLYQDLMHFSNEKEKTEIQQELSTIYDRVSAALSGSKQVKKRNISTASTESSPQTQREHLSKKRVITTDLDRVVDIVDTKGKTTLTEIQSKFNVTRRIAEEWIQILADYGVVEIRYLPVGGIEIVKPNPKK